MNYYLVNTDSATVGQDHPMDSWFENAMAAIGGDESYGRKFAPLAPGDICLMYKSEVGVIGVGEVRASATGLAARQPLYYTREGHLKEGQYEYQISVAWWADLRNAPINAAELLARGIAIIPGAVSRIRKGAAEAAKLVEEIRMRGAPPANSTIHAAGMPLGPAPVRLLIGAPYRPADECADLAPREPVEVDPDSVQRGFRAHARTQNALATYLETRGFVPRSPGPTDPEFDLAWEHNGAVFVAEVKSTTVTNEEKQLRLGLGQVLRYRQLFTNGGHDATAVLVAEREPSDPGWIVLCRNLAVRLVWPDVFERLLAEAST